MPAVIRKDVGVVSKVEYFAVSLI